MQWVWSLKFGTAMARRPCYVICSILYVNCFVADLPGQAPYLSSLGTRPFTRQNKLLFKAGVWRKDVSGHSSGGLCRDTVVVIFYYHNMNVFV